jgi:hypothetical protein
MYNNNARRSNKDFSGPANPKTFITPVIAPQITDLDHWGVNNLINHSHINTQGQWDTHLSGYNTSNCDSILPKKEEIGTIIEDFQMSDPYNNIQEYNKNLSTQTIQPGVYTMSEVIEPINSLIGISSVHKFQPLSSDIDQPNNNNYLEHNNDTQILSEPDCHVSGITESDVYDPRFSSYGTSYRGYTHKKTGQPRFYYDDINSVRMPNYVTRSNIDHLKYANTYGPINNDNQNMNDIRDQVQDSFLSASLDHRNDIMERLMRKRNSEMVQIRKYPKRT